MAISKVIYDGTTQIDLTGVTVATNNLVSPNTALGADGQSVTGNVTFVTYYTGSSTPSSSLGSNGDIYLKTGS